MEIYSCDQYQEWEQLLAKKLTFKIEEKIGLLFQICTCQNFQKVPHVMIPVEGKKRDKSIKEEDFGRKRNTCQYSAASLAPNSDSASPL